MSRPVKIAVLFLVTLIYACASWMIFDLQISIASAGFWLWFASLFLLIGSGFRVVTNKFFGSFFVSYLMFGIAGLVVLILVVLKAASLPIFNKDSYIALANISVSEFINYSMTEQDFSILPKQVAATKAAEDLSTQMSADSGFLLMGGDLQEVDGSLYYVFSLDNKDESIDSPGFVYVDAKTGTSTFKKTDVQMTYSPYKDEKHSVLHSIETSGGHKKSIVETRMELDEDFVPWWVSYEYGPAVSFMGGRKLSAIYLTNPFTGGSTKYNIEAIPSWLDYKISLKLTTDIFDVAFDLNELDVSIDNSAVLVMPRGGDLYAYYNLEKDKEKNGGVVFLNLKTGAASVYLQDTVSSERIMECLNAWSISTSQETINIPVLTKVNDVPCFVSPTYDEEGSVSGYLFVDGQGGSAYASGKTWAEAADNLKTGTIEDASKDTESDSTKQPITDTSEEGGEGVTYNLIAGYVDTITTDGNQYVITMVAMKPKYHIDSALITQEKLEAGKGNGLALQYPIEYDGKLEVYDCIPVDMSVMG